MHTGRRVAILIGAASLASVAACRDDGAAPQRLSAEVLQKIVAAPQAVVVAVGGTQQLSAVAYSLDRTLVDGAGPFTYSLIAAADTARVVLAPDGLITGRAAGAEVMVLVSLTRHGVTKGDTVYVSVTPEVASDLALYMEDPFGQTDAPIGMPISLFPYLYASDGTYLNSTVALSVQPADSSRVQIDRSSLLVMPLTNTGSFWLYGRITAYGVELRDSVQYTFTDPIYGTITVGRSGLQLTSVAAGQTMYLAPGGQMTFQNFMGGTPTAPTSMTVTFTGPQAVPDIAPLLDYGSSVRGFSVPGTYTWTATISAPAGYPSGTLSGTIVVR